MSIEAFAVAAETAEVSGTIETSKASMEAFEKFDSFLEKENETFGLDDDMNSEMTDNISCGVEDDILSEEWLEQENSKFGKEDAEGSEEKENSNNITDSVSEKEATEVESQSDEQTDGKSENVDDTANKSNEYSDLNSMKKELGKTYSEIKEDKPPNSPNIDKWFENGGTIRVEESDGKQVWTYTDSEGRSVQYIDGRVKFPPEAKHPVIGDISIGEFTGDRTKDKQLYLEKLEEEYGLTEIPDGYALHHDTENGVLQLVRTDYHKEFTHAGGHSIYKEDE